MKLIHESQVAFEHSLTALGRNPYTIMNHQRRINRLFQFLEQGTSVEASELSLRAVIPIRSATSDQILGYGPVDPLAIEEFLTGCTEQITDLGKRGRTRNLYLQSLQLFFQHEVALEKLAYDPTRPLRRSRIPRTNAGQRKYLTRCEYLLMEEAAKDSGPDSERNSAVIRTMRYSGVRPGELRSLTPSRVEFMLSQLHVNGKRGERIAPLTDALAGDLEQFMSTDYFKDRNLNRPNYPLFPNGRSDTPLSSRELNEIVKDLANRAGITIRVTPYTLRHTFATLAYEDGVPFSVIVRALGHERLQNTFFYVHCLDQQLRRISEDNAAEGPLQRAWRRLSQVGYACQLHFDFGQVK